MSDRGAHPVEWLRGLALSIERLAARGVASGAVRGAADELRAGLPDDLDAQARALLRDGLVVLERLAREAAASADGPVEAWSRTAVAGAARGAVEELRRLNPAMQPTTDELLRCMKLWFERAAAEAEERAQVIHAPGDQMRLAAAGAVAGAAEQIGAALPTLGPPAADLASHVGRGLVRGAAEEVGRQLRLAARSPLVRMVAAPTAACVAIAALLLAARRR